VRNIPNADRMSAASAPNPDRLSSAFAPSSRWFQRCFAVGPGRGRFLNIQRVLSR
jgi:hypothetical protein